MNLEGTKKKTKPRAVLVDDGDGRVPGLGEEVEDVDEARPERPRDDLRERTDLQICAAFIRGPRNKRKKERNCTVVGGEERGAPEILQLKIAGRGLGSWVPQAWKRTQPRAEADTYYTQHA